MQTGHLHVEAKDYQDQQDMRLVIKDPEAVAKVMRAAPGIEASEGDEIEVSASEVVNKTTGRTFPVEPLPRSRQAIIDAGGLIPYTRKRVLEAAGKA